MVHEARNFRDDTVAPEGLLMVHNCCGGDSTPNNSAFVAIYDENTPIRSSLLPENAFVAVGAFKLAEQDTNYVRGCVDDKAIAEQIVQMKQATGPQIKGGIYFKDCADEVKGCDQVEWQSTLGPSGSFQVVQSVKSRNTRDLYLVVKSHMPAVQTELKDYADRKETQEMPMSLLKFSKSPRVAAAQELAVRNMRRVACEIASMLELRLAEQPEIDPKAINPASENVLMAKPSGYRVFGHFSPGSVRCGAETFNSVAVFNNSAANSNGLGEIFVPLGPLDGTVHVQNILSHWVKSDDQTAKLGTTIPLHMPVSDFAYSRDASIGASVGENVNTLSRGANSLSSFIKSSMTTSQGLSASQHLGPAFSDLSSVRNVIIGASSNREISSAVSVSHKWKDPETVTTELASSFDEHAAFRTLVPVISSH